MSDFIGVVERFVKGPLTTRKRFLVGYSDQQFSIKNRYKTNGKIGETFTSLLFQPVIEQVVLTHGQCRDALSTFQNTFRCTNDL